jgi:hypothetical protein
VIFVTLWVGGREPTGEATGYEAIVWAGSVTVLVIGVALGTILVLERRSKWVLGALLLGSLVATVVLGVANTDPEYSDAWYGGVLQFIFILVVLGVALAVGAGIGGLWRLVAKVRGPARAGGRGQGETL